ncbi:uncharacterized protein LOC117652856 isoform X2 [Thrips palmi]|uniref:Uncharacterized protein LOC117652856 isoform X2 n=1 Tax=Thrips palmi TaxID=161013 RepID=A0A6P9A8Q6_THRPL|nr:uncharacterized protein LOC117652856 isoform X2 [Thrips palmi]
MEHAKDEESETACPTCKRPSDDSFMICCDKCDHWFHGKCVGQFVNKRNQMWNGPCCSNRWMGQWIKPRRAVTKTTTTAVKPIVLLSDDSSNSKAQDKFVAAEKPIDQVDKIIPGTPRKSQNTVSSPFKGRKESPWKVSALFTDNKSKNETARVLFHGDNIAEEPIDLADKVFPGTPKKSQNTVSSPFKGRKGSPWKVSALFTDNKSKNETARVLFHGDDIAVEPNGLVEKVIPGTPRESQDIVSSLEGSKESPDRKVHHSAFGKSNAEAATQLSQKSATKHAVVAKGGVAEKNSSIDSLLCNNAFQPKQTGKIDAIAQFAKNSVEIGRNPEKKKGQDLVGKIATVHQLTKNGVEIIKKTEKKADVVSKIAQCTKKGDGIKSKNSSIDSLPSNNAFQPKQTGKIDTIAQFAKNSVEIGRNPEKKKGQDLVGKIATVHQFTKNGVEIIKKTEKKAEDVVSKIAQSTKKGDEIKSKNSSIDSLLSNNAFQPKQTGKIDTIAQFAKNSVEIGRNPGKKKEQDLAGKIATVHQFTKNGVEIIKETGKKAEDVVSKIAQCTKKGDGIKSKARKRKPEKTAEDLNSSIDSDLSDDFQPKRKIRKTVSFQPPTQSSNNNDDWNVSGISEEAFKYLQTLLPVEFEHHVTAVQFYKLGDQSLTAVIRLPISDEKEALDWLTHYQASSFLDFRVYKTFPRLAKERTLFKLQLRCHHNTLPDKQKTHHKKHTECNAKIMITIKNPRMKKSTDQLLKSYPMEVRLRHWHNHPILSTDALRFRRPTQATKEIFLDYFKKGHTPSSALKCHKFDLQVQHGDDFFKSHADGSICPDLNWCYYQYYKVFKAVYGENYGDGMVTKLKDVIDDYNLKCNSQCADIWIDNDDIVVVICSPLMKRVHELLKSSSEVVIMDFSGNMDRYDTRVGFLIAPSLAGGLPLGIIMTSAESEALITKGLQMLQKLYPSTCFFGRGSNGPKVFITDDCKKERNSLAHLYPLAILLLCLFHILQAFLRYITAAEHGVKKEDKAVIYDAFRNLVRSPTEEEYDKQYEEFKTSEVLLRNKTVLTHVTKDLHPRRKEWALCYRSNLVIRGNNTSNLAEGNFLQLKTTVMERLKAFNMVQLFDFFVTKLEAYYQARIASVLNNRMHVHQKSKYYAPKQHKLEALSCPRRVEEHVFEVKNSKTDKLYLVDMEAEICSCPMGFTGAPCKHQYFISKTFNLSSAQFHDTFGNEEKLLYHKIMVGNINIPAEWYRSLKDGPQCRDAVGSRDVDEPLDATSQMSSHNEIPTSETEENPQHAASETEQAATGVTDSSVEVEVEKWREKLKQVFHDLDRRLVAKPDVFLPGVRAWLGSYEKMIKSKSENGVASSLFAMREGLRTGKHIKKQPFRRAGPHLGGRDCKKTGRPSKAARTYEHGYQKGRKRNGHMAPTPAVKQRHVAPHSLAYRVDSLLRKL